MCRAVIRHSEKDFDVSELDEVLADKFLRSVVKVGNELARKQKLKSMWVHIASILFFAKFLADPNLTSRIPADLKQGIAPLHSFGDWLHLLNDFSRYIQKNKAPAQARQISSSINTWLKYLAGEMICPAELIVPTILTNIAGKVAPKTQTILQVELSDKAKSEIEAIAQEVSFVGEDDLIAEARLLFHHVIYEFDSIEGLSGENLPLIAQATLERRLEKIYGEALKRFQKAIAKRKEGYRLIETGLVYMGIINTWLTAESLKRKAAKPILESVRALSDEHFMAGLLAWCSYYHEFPGLHPYEGHTKKQIVTRVRNEFGKQRTSIKFSTDEMIEYLGASRDLLSSGYLLILFETWANPDSIQRLSIHAKTDITSALSVVDWIKPRANAILSKFDIQRENGLSYVIESIIEATVNYRPIAIRADKEALFLHAYSSDARSKGRERSSGSQFLVRPSGNWFNDQAKELVSQISDRKWIATARQIRASLILAHSLKFGIKSAQEKAQHSSAKTTIGYSDSLPLKLKKEESIRVFMEWLQVLVTINIDEIPQKIGIAEEAYEEIKQHILNSRFGGVHCSDPFSGYQPGSEAGRPCTQIMMCMTCEKRMNVFIASEDNVAHLLRWREALYEAFEKGIISANDINWVLWKTFLDTMYSRMSESPKHKGLLIHVQDRLAGNDNQYRRVFFRENA